MYEIITKEQIPEYEAPLSVGQAVFYDRKSKLHPHFLPHDYIIT